ncbi:hypothetical protein HPB52_021359 [Rhipicephalus sanguineus]|uniref:Uncharacterized protein n=1 Tax=Rhipicephalus sanguineus TaxID=34632 RepID=A0A9D4SSV0_RHISA|nr:hypothetical protein HPB52_021359 [Rhipicephalus sanguineus]
MPSSSAEKRHGRMASCGEQRYASIISGAEHSHARILSGAEQRHATILSGAEHSHARILSGAEKRHGRMASCGSRARILKFDADGRRSTQRATTTSPWAEYQAGFHVLQVPAEPVHQES